MKYFNTFHAIIQGLLIKYLDNIKSMNTLTAVQYKSELNSFVKFVYDT